LSEWRADPEALAEQQVSYYTMLGGMARKR
jgi:hypothetical protein